MSTAHATFTEEEKAVHDRFSALINNAPDRHVSYYLGRFGSVVDADAARELCPEYRASTAARTLYSRATYPPARELVDRVFEILLESLKAWDLKPRFLFMSGGSGSGKSTAVATLPMIPGRTLYPQSAESLVIIDGTLSNQKRAESQIRAALDSRCEVQVLHVFCDYESAVDRVIKRGIYNGRVVALKNLSVNHVESRRTFKNLLGVFNRERAVTFQAIETSSKIELLEGPSLASLPDLMIDDLDRRAESFLGEHYGELKTSHPKIFEGLHLPRTR